MKRITKKMLDLLVPPVCPICSTPIFETGTLCPSCFAAMHFITDPCCQVCGHPFPFDTLGDLVCPKCLANPPLFHKAVSVLVYDDMSKRILLPFKHGDRLDFVPLMAKMMAIRGKSVIENADVIIPIPLHRFRLLRRKYNQSALLASAISKNFHKPYAPDGLKRIRSTPRQGKLSPEQRRQNVAHAFCVNKHYDFKDKSVLLIDDVLTTGATANECAKVLLKAGAKQIDILTFATAVPK